MRHQHGPTNQPTPCWNEMGCISILESLFPQEVCPDTQSVYNFILISSLHIISAIIPNYTGFKTVVAAEIECVSRLLSCSVVLKMTDILLHLCCLGLMWCWISSGSQSGLQGSLGIPRGPWSIAVLNMLFVIEIWWVVGCSIVYLN